MSQEINNFNVDILEKGIDWNTTGISQGEDVPELIVNGTSFALSNFEEESPGAYIGYTGSIQIDGKSRLLEVWLHVNDLAASSDPTVDWVEDITDSIYSIDLNSGDSLNLSQGQEFLCQATGQKNGSTYDAGTYSWKSEDTSIAPVDQTGKIVGIIPGSTTVQVFWEVDGICVYRDISVTVEQPK